ncbi:serine/threonine/tyrosine-interacting-like protein 1 [Denticeps clupeoides]|uniref:serine/threonine/tyrosine-interacting-like protein 1 n=1 Tax=Denticeps clupeoides TaxID=299321 RepID=UPI0010A4B11E|nr:serine/threonine/tyrosine-interacting-like protein 1 [Denticeps clupeoides]
MAGTVLCEPTELYNILNQFSRSPRLAESNYLCLIDTRAERDYNESHVITAIKAKWDCDGRLVMPPSVEVDSVKYIIVYDGNTSSLLPSGPARECAERLEKFSRNPIRILNGGYERFSVFYPFFRTQKIIYTIKELENLRPYPVEILPGQLYMGDHEQAGNSCIIKDLKLKALVSVCEASDLVSEDGNCAVMNICVPDSADADLYASFENLCVFVGSHLSSGSAVLIFSGHGISRCSAASMAFLVYHLKYTLKDAWDHVLQCKRNMRPNRGFVQQLSNWELQTLGRRITDVSEPNF